MFSVSCSRLAASVAAILGPKGEKPITFIINFHSKVFHFTKKILLSFSEIIKDSWGV